MSDTGSDMDRRRPRRAAAGGRFFGFTLIEMLLVIGVIAMILAVLLPSLAQARQAARQAACVVRIKATGDAMLLAATARDGGYLDTTNPLRRLTGDDRPGWSRTLRDEAYVGGGTDADTYVCPEDVGYDLAAAGVAGALGSNKAVSVSTDRQTSYSMTLYVDGPLVYGRPVRPAMLRRPAGTVAFAELDEAYHEEVMAPMFWGRPELETAPTGLGAAARVFAAAGEVDLRTGDPLSVARTRHGGASNYAFADGHVETAEFDELFNFSVYIDKTGQNNNQEGGGAGGGGGGGGSIGEGGDNAFDPGGGFGGAFGG